MNASLMLAIRRPVHAANNRQRCIPSISAVCDCIVIPKFVCICTYMFELESEIGGEIGSLFMPFSLLLYCFSMPVVNSAAMCE
mmetsp:Transcript_20184/g.26122  ORF Transcript_20184/g.26122 Transcript_20184/m.26122 type:complete len:83 (-) Transcript_20184:3-251(-)